MSNLAAEPLSTTEFEGRMRRIEALLEREQLDGLIGYSVGNQAGPVAYLTGYKPRFGRRDPAVITEGRAQRLSSVPIRTWE